jgi:Zn-dependent peptidase ImmA (M78 family)/DNA-binding XRE family transcriptional regulator
MIGERIKTAREAAGWNQRQLAEKAGISAMAISKYERDESVPSSKVLLAVAQALGLRTEYFFRKTEVKLEQVDYREHEKLPGKEEKKVRADVIEQLERWVELEQFIPTPWSVPFAVPNGLPAKVTAMDDIEDVALAVRTAWGLGLNPIARVIDTLESKGIKVIVTRYDQHKFFDGLAARVNGSPIIVVGKHWAGDRQRFTLAHELGHLILKGRLSPRLEEEAACHRFAGAFLVPKQKVLELLGAKRTWLEPQELMLLKQEWGLSMQGWSYRARELGVITQSTRKALWSRFIQHDWKEKEPEPQYPHEETLLFKQLVFRALGEELIGESKAAELLSISALSLNRRRLLA